jgi:hypothetical protein
MKKDSEYMADERERAAAFAAFTEYQPVGALYVLRARPDVAEIAIRRVAREGIATLGRYLEGIA